MWEGGADSHRHVVALTPQKVVLRTRVAAAVCLREESARARSRCFHFAVQLQLPPPPPPPLLLIDCTQLVKVQRRWMANSLVGINSLNHLKISPQPYIQTQLFTRRAVIPLYCFSLNWLSAMRGHAYSVHSLKSLQVPIVEGVLRM